MSDDAAQPAAAADSPAAAAAVAPTAANGDPAASASAASATTPVADPESTTTAADPSKQPTAASSSSSRDRERSRDGERSRRSRSSSRDRDRRRRRRDSRSRSRSRSPRERRHKRSREASHSRSRSRERKKKRSHRSRSRSRSRDRKHRRRSRSRSRDRRPARDEARLGVSLPLPPLPGALAAVHVRRPIQVVTRDQRAPLPPLPSADPLEQRPPPAPASRPAPLMAHVAPAARGKYAYVFLVMKGDSYACGAITGAYSLKLSGTRHSLVCMVTSDVSEACRATMRAVFNEVVEVPYLSYQVKPLRTQKQRNMYNAWVESAFTKWNMLSLINYEKTLFVDADKIAVSNVDHLFEECAAPAGTFSSPWSQPFVERKERIAARRGAANPSRGRYAQARGMFNPYQHCGHNARVTADMVHSALTGQSFVVIGTVVLLSPNMEDYEQYKRMLTTLLPFGFEDCHSMMDEQSLSYYFGIYKNQLIRNGEYGKATDVKGDAAPSAAASSSSAAASPSASPSSQSPSSYVLRDALSEWSYIHHQYNYVPWHRYWLEGEEVPYFFHFFNTKPWVLDRKAFVDLEAWWEVVLSMLADSSLSAEQRADLRALYPASMLDEGRIPGCCWCRLSEEQEGNNSGSWKGHNIFDTEGHVACPALKEGYARDAQRRERAAKFNAKQ